MRRVVPFTCQPWDSTNDVSQLLNMRMQSRWVEANPTSQCKSFAYAWSSKTSTKNLSTATRFSNRRPSASPLVHGALDRSGRDKHEDPSSFAIVCSTSPSTSSPRYNSWLQHSSATFPSFRSFVVRPTPSRRWCEQSRSRGLHVRDGQARAAGLASPAEMEREVRGRHLARERMERNRSRMARVGLAAKHGGRSAEDEGACGRNVPKMAGLDRGRC